MPSLVLASTSTYRCTLLERFGLPFTVARPEVDEASQPGEPPQALAERLALAKAEAVLASAAQDTWVIGSDQVAELDGQPLGKPGNHAGAIAQLRMMSGREVRFLTALCLAGPKRHRLQALDITTVRFRALHDDEIERYITREQPLDCAGSFKAEGLGIALFDEIDNRDPTALIGLPLIATARLLRMAGFILP
jgi:septum formation protein